MRRKGAALMGSKPTVRPWREVKDEIILKMAGVSRKAKTPKGAAVAKIITH